MDKLIELKAAANAAKAAFHAHHFEGSEDDIAAQIAFDMEEDRLRIACVAARTAYEDALKAYQASDLEHVGAGGLR